MPTTQTSTHVFSSSPHMFYYENNSQLESVHPIHPKRHHTHSKKASTRTLDIHSVWFSLKETPTMCFVFISSYVVRRRIIHVAMRFRAKNALTFLQKKNSHGCSYACICMIGRTLRVFTLQNDRILLVFLNNSKTMQLVITQENPH